MTSTIAAALSPVREGTRARWFLFALGAVMLVPVGLAGIVTLPLASATTDPQSKILVIAFAGSSLPEELLRFGVLYYVGMRMIGIARVRDGLMFGLLVSLGFSCAENVFYATSIGWATGLLKIMTATPIHLALGVTMGCLLAVAAGSVEKRRIYLGYALAVPLLLHGVYDMVILTSLAGPDAASAGVAARLAGPLLCYVLVLTVAVLTVQHARRIMRLLPGDAIATAPQPAS
jgi:RsiW-degrading membrane proteinase PrsW (M82 family)